MFKYRIVRKEKDGSVLYYPEKRFLWFFWKEIVKMNWMYLTESFVREEDAIDFINKLKVKDKPTKCTVVKYF
jgi:hypothetical protein